MKICKDRKGNGCGFKKELKYFYKGRSKCKECYNISRKCVHNKIKYRCIECGGSAICEHNIRKDTCRICGNGHCKHNKQKHQCVECGGSSICEHNIIKSRCIECGGGSICEHGIRKDACKSCGNIYCEHSNYKYRCIECGTGYCEHKILKTRCVECGGGSICKHDIRRDLCKICDLSSYLRNIINCRIRQSIKSENKTQHTIEYLGCSLIEYKRHIEKMFKKDMSWDNIGVLWHIDHIIPIKYRENNIKPSIEEQIKRLHYANTQPLYAIDNLRKGNRFVG